MQVVDRTGLPHPRRMIVSTLATEEHSTADSASNKPGGTLYRGNQGMWSWVLHRITGIAIFFFLLVHILDTALVRISPEAYNAVIGTYQTPLIGLGEVGLVGAVVFHALNGLRIILVDFWSKGTKYQQAMFITVLVIWFIIMIAFTPRHLINVFSH